MCCLPPSGRKPVRTQTSPARPTRRRRRLRTKPTAPVPTTGTRCSWGPMPWPMPSHRSTVPPRAKCSTIRPRTAWPCAGPLGDSALVQEVQHFLIDNGISLDSFSQVGARCPTVPTSGESTAAAPELWMAQGRLGVTGTASSWGRWAAPGGMGSSLILLPTPVSTGGPQSQEEPSMLRCQSRLLPSSRAPVRSIGAVVSHCQDLVTQLGLGFDPGGLTGCPRPSPSAELPVGCGGSRWRLLGPPGAWPLSPQVCTLTRGHQAAAERSKTVILAKNLPAGTLAAELQETFSCFGSLGRVLLPEGGVTAIVEFLEPLEARKAF
ncbi:Hypothetical predicted protein [Marmota monax]|uniref:RRM domain-containing protein n=1 Tax=Marmota monax TaxID=9995 RepID=A0A5E4D251_MARMO|nr:Hypothetical predicted protein [Marmota monax]